MIGNVGFSAWFIPVILGGFLLDWAAVALNWEKIKPFSKPLAMIYVMLWSFAMTAGHLTLGVGLLLLAQGFGLLGDVVLLVPKQGFLRGLLMFLIGHLFYISLLILFITEGPAAVDPFVKLSWRLLMAAGIWVGMMVVFYFIFWPLSRPDNLRPSLWAAIQIYGWVLSGMSVLTFLFAMIWPDKTWQVFLLPAGSLLFLFSDALLSYDRFLKPIPHGQLWVRMTYHAAQLSLAGGFLSVII